MLFFVIFNWVLLCDKRYICWWQLCLTGHYNWYILVIKSFWAGEEGDEKVIGVHVICL